MGGKKKVKAPKYEVWQGNEYIDRERQNLGTYGDWLTQNAINYLGGSEALNRDLYNQKAAQVYDTMWNDALANYRQGMNEQAAKNYSRFGSLGSTGAAYNQELFNRQQNDIMNRLASSQTQLAEQYYQDALANRRATAQDIYSLYSNAGNTITTSDRWTLGDKNRNIEAQYVADVQNAQRGSTLGNTLGGALSGAAAGFASGGPWGALAGGVLGGVGGALSGNASAGGSLGSLAGQGMYNYGQAHPTSFIGRSLGSGLNLNTKAQNSAGSFGLNTKYNPTKWKFSWQ